MASRRRLLAGLTIAFAGLWILASAQPAKELRSVVWGRAREALGSYRTVTDISGLVDVDSSIPKDIDAENLVAVCQARDEGIRRVKTWNEQLVRGLGIDDDPTTSANRALYATRLASVATYQGDVGAAIRQLKIALDAMHPYADEDPEVKKKYFATSEMLGATWLRAGEVENCLLMPNADRCLFPVLPGGVHVKQEGAKNAAALFTEYLASNPDDLEVRWLLNLSYMLLGTYPQDVPAQYVLKPEIFRSEIRMPRFMDVAAPTGFGTRDVAGGTIADDFDGDGLVDVILTSVDHCTDPHYFHNKGDGTFEDRTKSAGLMGQFGAINAVQTDYNNDGKLDIFMLRGGWEFPIRNSLMRNNGDNTFTDVTKAVGLSSGDQVTHSAAWGDYDNDGWLDVFVAHELQPGQLFHNRGDGTFEDVTAKSGIHVNGRVTKGVVFGDYDNDGYPDLYLSNVFGENMLFHNNKNGTFTEVGKQLGVEKPIISFPTWFFDYDNDGWLDIFVASYPNSVSELVKYYLHMPPLAETMELYHNNGNGTFTDVTKAVGLDRVVPAMGANFGDLDNDGYLDMYLGTGTPSFAALMPNIMLKNVEGKRFVDVTEVTGTGHLQKGHGIAFVDIDNDGDEDVLLNVGGAVPGDNYSEALYENPDAGGTNHWVSVKLVGVKTNRPAVGAKITVHLAGQVEGSPLRYREVTSGGSFGANSFMQHIGLGPATIESLEIEWPTSRTRQVFKDVPVDSYLEIHEFDKTFSLRHPKQFTLKHDMPAMDHGMTNSK